MSTPAISALLTSALLTSALLISALLISALLISALLISALLIWNVAERWRSSLVAALCGALLLAGCASSSSTGAAGTDAPTTSIADDADGTATSNGAADDLDLFDSGEVHDISVDFDQADYEAMIATFVSTGEKEWISATVTLDGVTYENVGLRLKGNSSLFGLSTETSGNPEELPWLIRLNEFVQGADHQDYEEIVIRSNSTETALNEAVAQEVLALAGLAAQKPIATAFTVDGSKTELRLAVEGPDEEWYEDNFADEVGFLYKAESDGDYSYRGDDPEAYDDVFDQEVGDDDMQPLIEFLDFINNADDATFSAELSDRLDVESFATYLAFQELIGNADDINGRGNNSYLQFDTTLERFTVVSWDLNLAFDTANVGGGGAGGVGGAGGGGRPPGGRGGGPGGESNVLVDRFLADQDFAALYAAKTAELTELLFTSGTVDDVISDWTAVLNDGAAALVSESTVAAEAAALLEFVDGVR